MEFISYSLSASRLSATFVALAAFTSIFVVSTIIYRAYFHPLAKYPGPWLDSVTEIPRVLGLLSGRSAFRNLTLHLKYGPVVRVAPNELSFNTSRAWKDIYATQHGEKTFIKDDDAYVFDRRSPQQIVTLSDVNEHARLRRGLSHAFSAKALGEQEELISEYIDTFIQQLTQTCEQGQSVNMTHWFETMTFNIIGDLSFGEPFDLDLSNERHKWIQILFAAAKYAAVAAAIRRIWFLDFLKSLFGEPKSIIGPRIAMVQFSQEKIQRRLNANRSTDRKDFVWYMTNIIKGDKLNDEEIAAHADVLVSAGSETTATALTNATWLLGKNPEKWSKLVDEVRGAFSSEGEIEHTQLQGLPFLNGVIQEALRFYSPISSGLPRVVPSGGSNVDGHFVPEGTIVQMQGTACNRSPENFHEPNVFLPERWMVKKEGDQDTNGQDDLAASQPFLLGPRGCIGQNLAKLEMRLVLAKLAWRFDEMVLKEPEMDYDGLVQSWVFWWKPDVWVRYISNRTTVESTE